MNKTQYDKLVNELKKYVTQYYNGNESDIEDPEFDSMYNEIEKIEAEHPEWIRNDSPTQKVMGTAENTFDKVEHSVKMLSLPKAMDIDELVGELNKFKLNGINEISIEGKLDGLACTMIYEKGKLKQAATRGDGNIGEDITQTVLLIPNIPKSIKASDTRFEVRGEIFLTKSGLDKINAALDDSNSSARRYKNVRNAASGILRNKMPNPEQTKYLEFGAYMLVDNNETKFDTHIEAMEYLSTLGFNIVNEFSQELSLQKAEINNDIESIKQYLIGLNEKRDNLDFCIDGIVFKANKVADQQRLGSKTNVPNWAIAYKFPAMSAVTILEDVEWLLGSKGNITPLAKIKPTKLMGVEISNVTLHNIEEIARLNVKIGDHVVIERRGDVIPKIVNVLENVRTGMEIDIIPPTGCPVCGTKVNGTGAFIRCDEPTCIGRLAGKIENMVTKLEIKDFGVGLINKIVEAGLVEDQADIFTLTEDQISNLDRTGTKTAKKIVGNIKNAISSPLSKVIAGLTLPGIGDNSGKNLSKKYGTLDKFLNAKYDEIIDMTDMGPTTTQNIVNWLAVDTNKIVLKKLINIGVGMQQEAIPTGNKLDGKKFAFTGALSLSRKEVEAIIESNGGESSSIKKGLDYLIVGEGAVPAKTEKAEKYGARIISENEFMEMVK